MLEFVRGVAGNFNADFLVGLFVGALTVMTALALYRTFDGDAPPATREPASSAVQEPTHLTVTVPPTMIAVPRNTPHLTSTLVSDPSPDPTIDKTAHASKKTSKKPATSRSSGRSFKTAASTKKTSRGRRR